jgi:DNA polymerase-3 subunit gamma/tau
LTHIALASKYRPRSFADVATQEHVSETLRRAVAGNRVGHAYLFCGPRGVGKTTLARVLAMALNCPDRTDEGEPCGQCESCTRIWGGHTALDVVEIDAASNRGVDDARDLRERAMYAPSAEGRHKVYIVDEAHMLTREAWNALLKILEEPPPRVIFVFATTEPHKIQQAAAPILSRCQRFDFRRIGVTDIVDRLTDVLGREGTSGAPEALRILARKADGGMRDALSLMDQVLSLTGGEVDIEAVRRVLGLVEEERYIELLDVLRDHRHADVFGLVQRLVDEGYDLVEFHHGLLDVLRVLLRLRLQPDAEVDVREDFRAALLERADAFEPGDLVRMLAGAADLESQGSLRRNPNPRLPIEMLLLRLSFLDRTVSFEELIRAMGGAPTGEGGAGGGGAASGAGRGTPVRASGETGAQTAPTPQTPSSSDRTEPAATSAPAGVEETPRAGGQSPGAAERAHAPVQGAAEPARGAPARAQGAIEASETAQAAWNAWLDAGRNVPKGFSAFLRTAEVWDLDDGRVAIGGLAEPAAERLAEPAVIEAIREGLAPHLGRAPRLVVTPSSPGASGARRVTAEEVRDDALKALYRQEPRLQRAVEELDLELMD